MHSANPTDAGPGLVAEPGRATTPDPGSAAAFQNWFELLLANDEALRDAAMEVRYAVYCEELGYEAADAFPDGKERDRYDERSLHCLLRHRPGNRFAGCIRLVLSSGDEPFPFESVCEGTLDVALSTCERQRFGEISRLAVHTDFRRRANERGVPYPASDLATHQPSEQERRVYPHLALGLYLGAAAVGLARGLEGVFALMERRLCVRLRRLGIEFEQVGGPIDHRGERIPYFIGREGFLSGLPDGFRPLLDTLRIQVSADDEPAPSQHRMIPPVRA